MAAKKQTFNAPELSAEDLTRKLYEANMELTGVNARLKDSEKRRRELLANLSHDLRSPIATIKNYTEYLLEFPDIDKPETLSVLENIRAKVLLLEYFMDEMLSITTLDAAKEDAPDFERLQVGMFLEEFFYSCRADLGYGDCNLKLNVPDGFTYYADIDAKLMYRALENLFGNALKYSGPGCDITLGAAVADNVITVSVADNGPGIGEADVKRIFERTYMVSKARTPGSGGGMGLGLSIVESIVKRHNGSVWCESVPGEGSTFYFTLPQAQPP